MKKILIGEKKFTISDQKYFSAISFDYNPIHYNLKSNSVNSKNKIVHGINILITAIDLLLKKEKRKPEMIQCNFIKPIKIYNNTNLFYYKIDKNRYSIEVKVKNKVHTKIIFDFNINYLIKNKNFSYNKVTTIKKNKKALNLSPESFVNKKFKIKLDKRINFEKFYLEKTKFGKDLYSSLLAISFFIGMVCPGKNAIFVSIKFIFNETINKNDYMYFFVKKFDKRINIFEIITKGFIQSEIKAFYRPSYQKNK